MMLASVESAARRVPTLRLWCCLGRTPLLPQVRARIAQSDILRERVTLLGARPHDEIEHLFRAADFYVQASHREASGFSLLEAMSCGTPAIATDIPSTRYIMGDTGSLTPVGNADAMADAIVSSARRDRLPMRDAVLARFQSALTFDAIGRQLRDAYQSLVQ
jgi:glycosyltransferase involved in cell wall biosynthesis